MAKKKIFFDMEFTGLHKLTTAISIGLVCEDGNKYYAEFTDFDKYQIDTFLRQEVLSKRTLEEYDFDTDYKPDSDMVLVKGDVEIVYQTLMAWLHRYEEDGVEMWGDLLAYDWVLFINIFGNGLSLPKFVSYIPMDLCTVLKVCGIDTDIDRVVFAYGEEAAKSNSDKKHNSLYDAETQLEVYKKIMDKMNSVIELMSDNEKETTEAEIHEEIVDTTPADEKHPKEEVKKTKKAVKGRPKKEKPAITSDVKSNQPKFIEPTQADVDSSEEFNPPI